MCMVDIGLDMVIFVWGDCMHFEEYAPKCCELDFQ